MMYSTLNAWLYTLEEKMGRLIMLLISWMLSFGCLLMAITYDNFPAGWLFNFTLLFCLLSFMIGDKIQSILLVREVVKELEEAAPEIFKFSKISNTELAS